MNKQINFQRSEDKRMTRFVIISTDFYPYKTGKFFKVVLKTWASFCTTKTDLKLEKMYSISYSIKFYLRMRIILKNTVFWDVMPCGSYEGILHSHRHENLKSYIAEFCSGDVMFLLWGKNWVFISQKTAFFIVTAVKTSNLTWIIFIKRSQPLFVCLPSW
jgi:hypothetical protein